MVRVRASVREQMLVVPVLVLGLGSRLGMALFTFETHGMLQSALLHDS